MEPPVARGASPGARCLGYRLLRASHCGVNSGCAGAPREAMKIAWRACCGISCFWLRWAGSVSTAGCRRRRSDDVGTMPVQDGRSQCPGATGRSDDASLPSAAMPGRSRRGAAHAAGGRGGAADLAVASLHATAHFHRFGPVPGTGNPPADLLTVRSRARRPRRHGAVLSAVTFTIVPANHAGGERSP